MVMGYWSRLDSRSFHNRNDTALFADAGLN